MNKSINQFLVEQEGGCWHEFKYNNQKACFNHYSCICGQEHTLKEMGDLNHDFSKEGNFIRLLKLAEKKYIKVKLETSRKEIDTFNVSTSTYEAMIYKEASDIPQITAELIAKALGWKG